MPSTASHATARHAVLFINPDTPTKTAILGGDFSSGVYLGELLPDSSIPDPEGQGQDYAGGTTEVQATLGLDIHVLGSLQANLSTIQTAKDTNPPQAVLVGITNHGKSAATVYQDGRLFQAFVAGKSIDPAKRSSWVKTRHKADTAEDIMAEVDSAITMPAGAP